MIMEQKKNKWRPILAAFLLMVGSAQLTACTGQAKKETGQVVSTAGSSEDEVPSAEGAKTGQTRETGEADTETSENTEAEDDIRSAASDTSTPDNAVNAEIEQKEIATQGNSVVQIPQFVTPSGESTKSLDELNKEANHIASIYENIKDKEDEWVEIHTYEHSAGAYLQATVTAAVHEEEETEENLSTLAYNKETDTLITSQDALAGVGLTGELLSIEVNQAFQNARMSGILDEIEMQGFCLDENGIARQIYMKLRVDTETERGQQAGFYSYDPAAKTLTVLALTE